MTFEELREALKEGKAVTCNNRTYVEIEDGQVAERYQKNDDILLRSTFLCLGLSASGILNNETGFEIYNKKHILDDIEKEYLESFLRPFTKEYEKILIQKSSSKNGRYYLTIKFYVSKSEDDIDLPTFSRDKHMYEGMKLYECYTLEELGLFK